MSDVKGGMAIKRIPKAQILMHLGEGGFATEDVADLLRALPVASLTRALNLLIKEGHLQHRKPAKEEQTNASI